jgi:hypothetical protein
MLVGVVVATTTNAYTPHETNSCVESSPTLEPTMGAALPRTWTSAATQFAVLWASSVVQLHSWLLPTVQCTTESMRRLKRIGGDSLGDWYGKMLSGSS